MTLQALGFRRLVLGLQPDAADRSAELACELASLFDLDLLGLFLDDISLRRLAAMPAARVISALGAWSPLAAALSPSFLEDAAESAERRFVEASRRLERRRFEIVRGGWAQALAKLSPTGDIVVITPPTAPADRAAEPFASLLKMVSGGAAAVLFAPPRLARSAGAIVAFAARQDDPSIQTARAIASAAGERLVIVDTSLRSFGERLVDSTAEAAARGLRGLTERLMVTSHGTIRDEVALALARAAPLLSLNPAGRERKI
jgi:hypothetical protein